MKKEEQKTHYQREKTVSDSSNNDLLIEHILLSWLRQARHRFWLTRIIYTFPVLLLLCSILLISGLTPMSTALISVVIWLVVLMLQALSKHYHAICLDNLTEHLNRHCPTLAESAQLLLVNSANLNNLQRIQKHHVSAEFITLQQQKQLQRLLPQAMLVKPLALSFLLMLALVNLETINHYLPFNKVHIEPSTEQITTLTQLSKPSLSSAVVDIKPPTYTKLAPHTEHSLDVEIAQGSEVTWLLTMSDLSEQYQLIFSDGLTIDLVKNSHNQFTATHIINTTGLYRIVYSEQQTSLNNVYSVSVNKDKAPEIRLLKPSQTITKIARNGEAVIDLAALIRDDFGLTKVEILASVAKGSGEGVKFRDQQFIFDHSQPAETGELFNKRWHLSELGMEPGDEVYFTVYAWDNKSEQPQQSRSSTIIVRWLDEKANVITAEGIVIDFIPEYFRSQRQIIIETEQLLADRNDISAELFSETSQDLGRSQSDLKQRYGQYLGDEFGEGAGEQLAEHSSPDHNASEHGETEHDDHASHQDEDDTDKQHQKASSLSQPGHEHHSVDDNQPFDKSGASALISRFGHNHGEADIGPVTQRNPRALMKRAVSVMWQAELHLMLSEPAKALPFEREAYKYLQLAQQADRIYVKRLGFEPPPVKESNRLTGELKEILTYHQQEKRQPNQADDQVVFKQVFEILNNAPGFNNLSIALSNKDRQLLSLAKARLTELAQARPALIKQAATIEKILITNVINQAKLESTCEKCLLKLQQKLWQLLPAANALPYSSPSSIDSNRALYRDYQQVTPSNSQSEKNDIVNGGRS